MGHKRVSGARLEFMVATAVSAEQKRELEKESAARRISASAVLREALHEYLAKTKKGALCYGAPLLFVLIEWV